MTIFTDGKEHRKCQETFNCEICFDPIPLNKKFKNKNMCEHIYCIYCINKYIDAKVEDRVANLKCPGIDCEKLLDPLSCRPIIPVKLFNKWCDILCDSAILGFERCYCPNQHCSALVVDECGGTDGRSECPNCKKLYCFKCKIPWHAGYQCSESRQVRDRNDILFGELVEKKNWARCPGCNHCVERTVGCSIVKCRCMVEFCYRCGRKRDKHWCDCEGAMYELRMCIRFLGIFFLAAMVLMSFLILAVRLASRSEYL